MNKVKAVNISVVGASGRMGGRVLAMASQDPRFFVVAGVEAPKHESIGHFTADGKAPIVGNIEEVLYKTDVAIDFTSPQSTLETARQVAQKGRALVVGTTGLKPAEVKKLKDYARRIAIVFSPNMSVGMNLLFELVKRAAATLPQYDIEIVEAHHNKKKDAPSGTAMKLAEIAAEASNRSSSDFVFGRKGLVGPRTKKEIGIMSLRAGDIVGDHTVLISNIGERLELTHRAHSRDALALGALDAAYWVARRRPGLYSMADVLGFK